MSDCNGWTNRETWLFNLWMSNDEGSQQHIDEMTKQAFDNAEGNRVEAAHNLAGQLEEDLKLSAENYTNTNSLIGELLSTAIANISFIELADCYINDIDE